MPSEHPAIPSASTPAVRIRRGWLLHDRELDVAVSRPQLDESRLIALPDGGFDPPILLGCLDLGSEIDLDAVAAHDDGAVAVEADVEIAAQAGDHDVAVQRGLGLEQDAAVG